MKIINAAAIAALLATSMISTPASAAKPPLGPPATDGLSPQEVCDLQLTPDEHSDFETYPINVVDSGLVNVGDPYAGTPAGDPEGYGTPTPSGTVFDGTFIRHGGSPNVWGGATSTLTYPQTRQLFNFLQDVQRTTGFDCFVFKIVGHERRSIRRAFSRLATPWLRAIRSTPAPTM